MSRNTNKKVVFDDAQKWAVKYDVVLIVGQRDGGEWFWVTYKEYINNFMSEREARASVDKDGIEWF